MPGWSGLARSVPSSPPLCDARAVRVDQLSELWPEPLRWDLDEGPHPAESHFLTLDSTKAHEQLGWEVRRIDEALAGTVSWHLALREGRDMRAVTLEQIEAYASA